MNINVTSDKKFIFLEDLEEWAKERNSFDIFDGDDEVDLLDEVREIETHNSLKFNLDELDSSAQQYVLSTMDQEEVAEYLEDNGHLPTVDRTGERWFDELKREWLEEHINDITLEQLEGLLK